MLSTATRRKHVFIKSSPPKGFRSGYGPEIMTMTGNGQVGNWCSLREVPRHKTQTKVESDKLIVCVIATYLNARHGTIGDESRFKIPK